MSSGPNRINTLFAEKAEYWDLDDLQIDYLNESITLKLLSCHKQQIKRTYIFIKEVMSFFVYQEPNVGTIRLNDRSFTDANLLSEISYHKNGFGHIKIESLESDLKEIEKLHAKTNFYFQVNNKDSFFIEANSVQINDERFVNLFADSRTLKYCE
ncbi:MULTISPECIES: YxiG family protein [Cytobacillus]|uniref:Uncharacterized protein n=1 Tax=Cytobacillus kochii TaxID=859143 RepID=A0A248TMD2_9BACI|nr:MULTISPECIES: hypothetical protein [Cytobacillus]ASV69374.1 hypothetical protein CKF48_19890 [Cytobacillus kochii]MDQ0184125.1 hypothetical protein [Cytobacillus kochii]MEA1852696.1 hypothetical protein [Cytobacillus sp. OWB-43]